MEQQAAYSFQVKETENGNRFIYQKTKPGLVLGFMKLWGLWVLSVLITSFLSLVFSISNTTVIVMLFFLTLGVNIYFYKKKGKIGSEASFEITKSGLVVGGHSYSKEHITSLFIKDPQGNAVNVANVGSTVVVGGRGMMGAAAVGAHVMGQSIMAVGSAVASHEAKKNFKIMLRYGEKDVVLADKLRQNTAEVMFDKVKGYLQ